MFSPGRPAQVEKHGELERLTREGVITFTTAMLYATNAGNCACRWPTSPTTSNR